MKDFTKEVLLPLSIDLVVSALGYGRGIKLAEKIALKTSQHPRIANIIKSVGGFFLGGAQARTAVEARKTFAPIASKEKEEAYQLPQMMERIKEELPADYLLMLGGTAILYTIKGGYVAGKKIAPQGLKDALRKTFDWGLDKFLFGVKKEAREKVKAEYANLLSQKHLELPALFPYVQRFIRSEAFQEYVQNYMRGLYKAVSNDPKKLHLVNALSVWNKLDSVNPPGQRISDYMALENFLIKYYSGDPKFLETPVAQEFAKLEKHPAFEKLMKEKVEAFFDNYKVLLKRLIEEDKENLSKFIKEAKALKKAEQELTRLRSKISKITEKLGKTTDPAKVRDLKADLARYEKDYKKLEADFLSRLKDFQESYPVRARMLRMTLEEYRDTPTPVLVERLFELVRDDIEPRAKSYLVRNVLRIPKEPRVRSTAVMDFIEDYWEDLIFDLRPFSIYIGAWKRREFPTLGSRFLHFLERNIHPFMNEDEIAEVLKNIYFHGNITPSKAFLISFQYPKVVRNYRNILHSLRGTEYVDPPGAMPGKDYVVVKYADFAGAVHNDFKQLLDQISHYSALREDIIYGKAKAVWGAIANINGLLKFWLLKFSPFHFSALGKALMAKGSDSALFWKAFGNSLSQAFYKKDAFDLMEASLNVADALAVLHKKGFSDAILTVASDVAERQGLARSLGNFVVAKLSKLSPHASIETLRTAQKVGDLLYDVYNFDQRFLWDGFWRTTKILSANELVNAWRKGLLTDEQLAREIRALNDIFGGAIDWYLIPYTKAQGIRLLLFAPDWYLSLWRNLTTWLKGDTITSADFFPALARLHLYFANLINYYRTGKDLFDEYQVDKWGVTEWITNWRNLYKIQIPFTDKTGRRRVLVFDTIKIDFEPLEMIPVLPFLETLSYEIAKEKDFTLLNMWEKVLARTAKHWLEYWYGKKSTLLNMFAQIGSIGLLFRTSDDIEFWDKLMGETIRYLVPLSFLQLFNLYGRVDRYLFTPEEQDWVRFLEALQSFAFKLRASERFADYVAKNLYNPVLPEKITEFMTQYFYLSYIPKNISRMAGIRKTEVKEEAILRDMIRGLAKDLGNKLIGYKVSSKLEDLAKRIEKGEIPMEQVIDHLAQIYYESALDAVRALENSYLPPDLKEETILQIEKVILQKAGKILPYTVTQKLFKELREEMEYGK